MSVNNVEKCRPGQGNRPVDNAGLLLDYAKLIFWLVSFGVIMVFVYLYSHDMRERTNKSWHIANELQTNNERLNQKNALLKRQIIDFEIRLMQKNAQINTLEHTIEELRKGNA